MGMISDCLYESAYIDELNTWYKFVCQFVDSAVVPKPVYQYRGRGLEDPPGNVYVADYQKILADYIESLKKS